MHVSSVIITLAGSMDPVGMGVSKIASKGGCGGDRGSVVHVPLSDRRLGERQS